VPDPATNHVGVTDANGNLAGYSYDVENRVLGGGGVNYNYAPGNKRLMRASCCTTENQTGYNFPVASEEVTFWSVSGQRMATYTIAPNSYIGSAVQTTASMTSGWNVINVASSTGIGVGQTVEGNGIPANTTVTGISYNNITLSANPTASGSGVSVTFLSTSLQLVAAQTGTWYYFGGKLVKNKGGYVGADRLGSIGKYYPYGQEKPSATTNGTEKFTGYMRDSETGLDYADQRYHSPGTGRFLTPDPWPGSVHARDPRSWNKYAYTHGDPINRIDPTGTVEIDGCDPDEDPWDCDGGGGGGGGPGSCGPGTHWVESLEECVDDPPEQDPLQCFFVGYETPPAGWATTDRTGLGYYTPVYLDFFSTGGTGVYNYSDSQTVTFSGTVTYSSGQTINLSSLNSPPLGPPPPESLTNQVGAGNANASFFDSPGIAMTSARYGTIVSASFTRTYTLNVTVRSGNETANCQQVKWTSTETWFSVDGNVIASGGVNVLTPYTPHP
jgi:RHS repeat-associated protein